MYIPWIQQIMVILFIRRICLQATNALTAKPSIIHPEQLKVPENIISISPGGFMGIYMFGICTYIKDNYNLDPYVFSGASAGAWNALMMTYNPPPNVLLHDIHLRLLENKELNAIHKINDIEHWLKRQIISTYDPSRFELSKLYIGTTTLNCTKYSPQTTIFHDFHTLEEAIDCCIASSHIPFVSGGALHRFRSQITFDGGFSRNPYLTNEEYNHVLHIKPNMWDARKATPKYNPLFDTTIFSRKLFNFKELYEKGYSDAEKNKPILDDILNNRK